MPKSVLTGYAAVPDVGELKRSPGEWRNLQNIRGWGGKGAKRRGVQTRMTLSTGVMGMFDLKNDGDPLSPDKIIVMTYGGTIEVFEYSEFITTFDFMVATGVAMDLQAPNLKWYSVMPTTGETGGKIQATEVVAPSSSLSSDLLIGGGQNFGFADSTGVWQLGVNTSNPVIPKIFTKRFATSSAGTTYSSTLAFATGYGPIFTTAQNRLFRLQINNANSVTITEL